MKNFSRLICTLLLHCTFSNAETLKPADCIAKWKTKPLGVKVLAAPSIAAALKQNPSYATLQRDLSSWTPDFIAAAALELEQQVLSACVNRKLMALLGVFHTDYVRKMGWVGTLSKPGLVFRALVTTGQDRAAVETAVTSVATSGKKPAGDQALVKQVYGEAELVDGIWVVGGKATALENLKLTVRQMCKGLKSCPFWDPSFITHVTILPGTGVAQYVPEIGVLRLSEDLVAEFTPLKRVIIAHELAHAAIRRAELKEGKLWTQQFAELSAWKKEGSVWRTPATAMEGLWQDELTVDSLKQPGNSQYRLQPDPPMPAVGEVDGFVFAKTAREVQTSGDVAEDVADHIAAFVVYPSRYCYRDKPIAPSKYSWVAENVFGKERSLDCNAIE